MNKNINSKEPSFIIIHDKKQIDEMFLGFLNEKYQKFCPDKQFLLELKNACIQGSCEKNMEEIDKIAKKYLKDDMAINMLGMCRSYFAGNAKDPNFFKEKDFDSKETLFKKFLEYRTKEFQISETGAVAGEKSTFSGLLDLIKDKKINPLELKSFLMNSCFYANNKCRGMTSSAISQLLSNQLFVEHKATEKDIERYLSIYQTECENYCSTCNKEITEQDPMLSKIILLTQYCIYGGEEAMILKENRNPYALLVGCIKYQKGEYNEKELLRHVNICLEKYTSLKSGIESIPIKHVSSLKEFERIIDEKINKITKDSTFNQTYYVKISASKDKKQFNCYAKSCTEYQDTWNKIRGNYFYNRSPIK